MYTINASVLAQWPILSAITILVLTLTFRFVTTLVSHRRYFRKLQAQGLPMPPHSLIFGHIPVLIKAMKSLPGDAHGTHLPYFIIQNHPEIGPDFYLDLWPLSEPFLSIGSPETLYQAHSKYALGKNYLLRNFLLPLTDGLDIVSMNGAPWKKWRSIFNPGFSLSHLMKFVPVIVENTKTYCSHLDKHAAEQDIFPMKDLTDNLIIDVIGEAALDMKLNSQKAFNPVVNSLRTQVRWMSTGADLNYLNRFNPRRPLTQWYHGRIVNQYINKKLDEQIEEWQKNIGGGSKPTSKSSRTITDLALHAYSELHPGNPKALQDSNFKKICASQLKIFLFAGHDTTSSGICFNLWCLSQNPEALSRIRQEHDSVFGSDPSQAADLLIKSPHLISQLEYTTAVIKETLRLFTPVTSTRLGEKGVNLTDSQGRLYPTDGVMVWSNPYSVHRDPAHWVSPLSFKPERWLASPNDPLHPTKEMYRPFEQGPRNCLGQELAMLEMKVVLVLLSRSYIVKPAYDELDKRSRTEQSVLGVKAYQVGIMQPKGDLPVRVERINVH